MIRYLYICPFMHPAYTVYVNSYGRLCVNGNRIYADGVHIKARADTRLGVS